MGLGGELLHLLSFFPALWLTAVLDVCFIQQDIFGAKSRKAMHDISHN
jgi:hypothetical protein